MLIHPLQHLLFNVLDVGELGPASDVHTFAGALDLQDEVVHQGQFVHMLFPEMLFARVSGLLLPMFDSTAHILPGVNNAILCLVSMLHRLRGMLPSKLADFSVECLEIGSGLLIDIRNLIAIRKLRVRDGKWNHLIPGLNAPWPSAHHAIESP